MSLLDTRARRLATFSLLYLSEGIPFGFSAIALVAYLRGQGVGLTEIGVFTAWLYGPWSFKWAWAPLVDLIRPRRFGPRRFWIVGSHVLMILTLAVLLLIDPEKDLRLLIALMTLHNIFAATQDVAIDALAIDILPEEERATANGFMFGGSTLGQAVGGSGALYVAGQFGFEWSYAVVLGALAVILITVSLRLREAPLRGATATSTENTLPAWPPPDGATQGGTIPAGVVAGGAFAGLFLTRLRTFFADLFEGFFRSGRGPLLGVLFAVLPSGAVALGLALGSTLEVDLGMTERQIADLTLVSTLVGATGCVVGGFLADRFGHRRTLVLWYLLTAVPTLWLARAISQQGIEGLALSTFAVVSIVYSLMTGLLNGTYLAIFMGLTSPRVAASQFTGYMALGNLAYTYSSAWQGKVADGHGYPLVLVLDACIVLLAIAVMPFLQRAGRPDRGDAVGHGVGAC